ncbi:MAG: hypothetical protein Q9190_002909 [Brigantiaea leucoxantha]
MAPSSSQDGDLASRAANDYDSGQMLIPRAALVEAIPFEVARPDLLVPALSDPHFRRKFDERADLIKSDIDKKILTKRDVASDVCGDDTSIRPVADNLNKDTWTTYNIGEWFVNFTRPYTVLEWKYTFEGETIPDIQSLILQEAGEGKSKCDKIQEDSCSTDGYDRQQCLDHPELHFVWAGVVNFAHFLYDLYQGFLASTVSISTGDFVQHFYHPQQDPTQLIVPISILSGIAGALSGTWPIFAIPAGAGAVINGALTQSGLDQADPLEQWQGVDDAVKNLFKQCETALEAYFDWALRTTPSTDNYYIEEDPASVVSLLHDGYFAAPVDIGVFPPGVYGTLASSAINALWVQDQVLFLRLSEKSYGSDPCKAFPDVTVCLDGIAYILIRWVFTDSLEIGHVNLDPDRWQVYGAYKVGDGNDDHLKDYALSKENIAASAWQTQQEGGFLNKNQNGMTIDALTKHPKDLKVEDLASWNIPVCDIDKILNGKVLQGAPDESGDNGIAVWGACTCLQDPDWPADQYPDADNSYQADECRDKGWGDTAPSRKT